MIDTSVKYLGITIKNPIVVGSCGLTSNIENLKKLESSGAGAIVLKSIFEEQILQQTNFEIQEAQKNSFIYSTMSETLDYIDTYILEKQLDEYIQLISQAKKQLLIPVIASINCISDYEWTKFAKRIEIAGADAIELNIFLPASDETETNFEQTITSIISQVSSTVTIPIAVKISSSFTKISKTIQIISQSNVAGIVLFNRFYSPDIDLDTLEIINSNRYSSAQEYTLPLRWIALNSSKVSCDLIASTGIHTGDAVIKQLLVGASAVQIVSALYLHGFDYIQTMLQQLETFMQSKGYQYIDQFKGKLAVTSHNAASFERIQFMKYFAEIGK
ncbi:MAG TPA: dihydroorotate dehydrogenase-like protein [Bacteroidales bacterium]|nr:dihydroorotate dehydrogenase-like protein [Bacteroidales bacterium]